MTIYNTIKETPEILYITASTYFKNQAEFDEMIPGLFVLLKLLTLGKDRFSWEID